MANDFHHMLKQNISQYRSSYSQIPIHNNFNFNIQKLSVSEPQYQYSSSFNDHLNNTNCNINSPSTPLCSDTEDDEEYNEYEYDIENTYNTYNNKWYMAFPGNDNKNNNNISRSEPDNNIPKQQQTDIYSNLAKTKIFPTNRPTNKPKHQLYGEGNGYTQYNSDSSDDEYDGFPITIMGYTNNYDNEGDEYNNNNIQNNIGFTLMGNIQTNNDINNINENENNNENIKENITLMGDRQLEGKIIQFEIKNNNFKKNESHKTGITLMGYCNCNKNNITFVKPQ